MQYVSVRVPFQKGYFAVKLTGIPPCVAHLAAISGLKDEMPRIAPNLLNKIQTMLDGRTFGGGLSETRKEALCKKLIGSKIEGIHVEMKRLLCNQQVDGDGGNTKIGCKELFDSELFLHPNDVVFLPGTSWLLEYQLTCDIPLSISC